MLCGHVHHKFLRRLLVALRKALENIVTSEGPRFGDLQWRLTTLHIRSGGLVVYDAGAARMFAFVASRVKSIELENHILRECDGVPIEVRFLSAQDSLQLVLSNVDFAKLTTREFVPLNLYTTWHIFILVAFTKVYVINLISQRDK